MVNARTFLWALWGLGLSTGVSYGGGWWDFEYDGSVTPDVATPAWNVDYTEASTDGNVLSFTTPGKWNGMRLRVADGTWNETDSTTMEVRFKWLGGGADGVFNYERPKQWQAVFKAGLTELELGQVGERPQLPLAVQDWTVVRFLMNSETNAIDTYLWPLGEDVGSSNNWPDVELAADHTGWTGFGTGTPAGQGAFLIGGQSFEIDYVRWTHSEMVPPGAMPTLVGDLNGDGRVDIEDFGIFAGFFGETNTVADLNGDDIVDIEDFGMFAQNFGVGTAANAVIIPEPATLALLGLGGLMILRRLRCPILGRQCTSKVLPHQAEPMKPRLNVRPS